MRITSGGSLLVGTTSNPYSLGALVVNHNSSLTRTYFQRGVELIEIVPSDGTQPNQISSSYTSSGSGYKPLSISARQNQADLYLTTSGLVGIGTTSPNALLDAYTSQGGTTIAASHGTGGSYPKVSGISFGATSTSLSVSNNGGTTTFIGGAGIYANNTASSNNPTELIFWTTAAGSPTERMRITSGGELQVTGNGVIKNQESGGNYSYWQQTSSDARLAVQYSQPLLFLTNATERMRITSGGDIGISANSVIGSGFGYAGNTVSSASAYLQLYNGSSGETKLWNTGYYAMIFGNGNSERMRLNSGGELLINTTSDAGDYKLQVNGNIYTTGQMYITGNVSGYSLILPNGQWFGVGGANPNRMAFDGGNQLFHSYSATGAYKFRNSGDTNDALTIYTTGNVEAAGSIKTAAPSGGTAKPWKLGEAGVTLGGSNTSGVRVEIDGTVYYLVTGYLP